MGSHDVGLIKCVCVGYAHGTHTAQMTQGVDKYFPVLDHIKNRAKKF